MWYPVLDEERGMVMNKSQPDLVEVVAEGGCLLLLDDEYLKLVRIIDGGMALGWPDGQEVYPEALFAMSERVR